MAYSDSFPATRPVFQADFANGGRVDPRISYSRSTTGTYFGTAKHESSQNLFVQSSDFDTTWDRTGVNVPPTGGQADPSGGTDGFTWVEDTQTTFHQFYQNITASGELALTIYAKQNSGTRYLMLRFYNGSGDWTVAVFDLAGGAPLTVNSASSTRTSVSATQTASGGGFYKCTLKATGSTLAAVIALKNTYDTSGLSSSSGAASYAGDNSSIDVAFASLTTTGATDYNATTTQIHREYAPTLQTAAINAPRFEYSASDSASMGLLVEGSSTQLLTYSSDMTNVAWTENGVTASAEAIGPDGTLSAVAVREDTGTSTHLIRQSVTLNGTAATFSVYAKILGNARRLVIREDAQTGSAAVFDLTTGTVASEVAGGTGTITPVGNGWYRCTMLCAPSSGSRLCSFWVVSNTATNYETTTGDGYSGLLLAMPQAEQQSFSSSWISSTSSTVTRAADSASAVTADIGYTGGPLTLFAETTTSATDDYRQGVGIYNSSSEQVAVYGNSYNNRLGYVAGGGLTAVLSQTSANGKSALSIDTNDVAASRNGNSPVTDTSQVLPNLVGATLTVGGSTGSQILNGHVKRIALYGEALSDTNLQALTS